MHAVAARSGSPTTRSGEQATLGGNIVNASPAADGTPPLLAHERRDRAGARRDGKIAARAACRSAEFVIGPGKTALEDGEILVAIDCDALPGYGGSVREGRPPPLAGDLARLRSPRWSRLDASASRFEDVRLAIGGVGPVPCRLADVEALPARQADQPPSALEEAADMPVDLRAPRARGRPIAATCVRGFVNARPASRPCSGAGGESAARSLARVGGSLCLISSIEATVNGRQVARTRQAASAAARFPARRPQPHRHQGRLRRRRMRHLLGVRRRRADEIAA